MGPPPGCIAGLQRHSKTSDSEKGGMTMLRKLLVLLVVFAVATALALTVGRGGRGMSDGGLRASIGTAAITGMSDGGLSLGGSSTPDGMSDGGL